MTWTWMSDKLLVPHFSKEYCYVLCGLWLKSRVRPASLLSLGSTDNHLLWAHLGLVCMCMPIPCTTSTQLQTKSFSVTPVHLSGITCDKSLLRSQVMLFPKETKLCFVFSAGDKKPSILLNPGKLSVHKSGNSVEWNDFGEKRVQLAGKLGSPHVHAVGSVLFRHECVLKLLQGYHAWLCRQCSLWPLWQKGWTLVHQTESYCRGACWKFTLDCEHPQSVSIKWGISAQAIKRHEQHGGGRYLRDSARQTMMREQMPQQSLFLKISDLWHIRFPHG